jgi:hypothetical protein
LEKFNPEKFSELSQKIKAEIAEEPVLKYEYWADPPFRTKRKQSDKHLSSEEELLKTIYPNTI